MAARRPQRIFRCGRLFIFLIIHLAVWYNTGGNYAVHSGFTKQQTSGNGQNAYGMCQAVNGKSR